MIHLILIVICWMLMPWPAALLCTFLILMAG